MHPAPWSRWLTVCAAAVAAGCSTREAAPPPPAAPNVVTVTAVNYAFAFPDTVAPGATRLVLINHGTEMHHLQLVRLVQGRTLDSLVAALRHPGPLPAWAQMVGGPNATVPGDTTTAIVMLTEGHYAALCLIPGPDNKPHFTKGMIRPLEVRAIAAGTAVPPEPAADAELHLKDYDFTLSASLTAGAHMVRVVNDGPQPHEVVLAMLAPGKTPQDLLSWVDGGMHGQPPAKPVGGITGLMPGRHALWPVHLAPGSYAFICFFPAPDGREHAAHGMMKQFTVS